MSTQPFVIYHANCADGFGAAWAVRARFPGAEFYAGMYSNEPPDVTGRDVILVDFSYKRQVMLSLGQQARSVLVIDHHKSAIEDLQADGNYIVDMSSWQGPLSWERHMDNPVLDQSEGCSYARIFTVFDLHRSGAGLTWDFFHPGKVRPRLIDHIEDRDLWRFKLPGTREIQAALFSYPYDFGLWDDLMAEDTRILLHAGEAIERKHHKDIAELIGVCQRFMRIAGNLVPVASLPYTLTSDAGHKMAEQTGAPFAACYWDTPAGRVFSLRSTETGADVSEIAKQFGGGGHKHAAGFRVPPTHALATFHGEAPEPRDGRGS